MNLSSVLFYNQILVRLVVRFSLKGKKYIEIPSFNVLSEFETL